MTQAEADQSFEIIPELFESGAPLKAIDRAVRAKGKKMFAAAHRDYSLTGSSIRVEKYTDRIAILSPGLLPPPLTLEKLRTLRCLPCSRNPNLARGLSFFERLEEQGAGLRRMVTVTANMGLPAPRGWVYRTNT